MSLEDLLIKNIENGIRGIRLGTKKPNEVKFEKYYSDPDNVNTLSDNRIRKITSDKNGNLWVATVKGLNHFDPKTGNCVRYLNDPKNPKSLN